MKNKLLKKLDVNGCEKTAAKRNSDLLKNFLSMNSGLAPKLAWKAGNALEHEVWRRRFTAKLKKLVGHMPPRVPLRVEWTETHEEKGFTRYKIYIRSEENYWVPAFYFVPRGARRARPAIVCLHGHSGIYPYIREGDPAQRQHYKDHALDYALFLAERGYVTIAVNQRGWDETAASVDKQETGCHRMVMNSFLLGMTPVGLRCRDASCALDFLETQDIVDSTRIGAAGLSGGGTITLFWTALEKRVKLAMIAGYYCTFADSIFSIYHCLCNCVPGMMEWGEMRDIAALIAPRPALMINGIKDPIFPIAATRMAYAELKQVYKTLGVAGNLDADFFAGGHAWSNRKTLRFLKKHFGKAL